MEDNEENPSLNEKTVENEIIEPTLNYIITMSNEDVQQPVESAEFEVHEEGLVNTSVKDEVDDIPMSPKFPEVNYDSSLEICQKYSYVIETEEIAKRIGMAFGARTVLSGVNLRIPPSQIFIIHGARKSGKSTLLKIILGLIAPTFGAVQYNLMNIKLKPGQARVRYIPEKGGLYENCTIEENVYFFGRICNFKERRIHEVYHHIIGRIHASQLNLQIQYLHEDEVKRLSFYIAIMENPDILIADEVTSNIDPVMKHEIWTQMRHIQQKYGTTIVLTTSDVPECEKGDWVAYLRHGRIIESAPPSNYLRVYGVDTIEKAICNITANYREEPQNFAPHSTLSLRENPGYPSMTWLSAKEMNQQFYQLFRCSARFCTIFYILLCERFLSVCRDKFVYLFLGLILPIFTITTFYFGIGQDVNNAVVGIQACNCTGYSSTSEMGIYCQTLSGFKKKFPNICFSNSENELSRDLDEGKIRVSVSYFDQFRVNESMMMKSACENFSLTMETGSFKNSLPVMIKFDASIRLLSRKIHDIIKQVEDSMLEYRNDNSFPMMPLSNVIESKFAIHSDYMDAATEADAIVWGFLVIVIFSTAALIGAWPMVRRHSGGHFDRLRNLGLQVWHFEASRIFDLCLVLFYVAYFVFITWFLTRLNFEPVGVVCIYYMLGIFGMALGMLLAVVLTNEMFIFVTLASINSMAVILSGALWPQDALVKPYYIMSQFLPHTHAVEALQTYIFRQTSIWDERVLRGLWLPGTGAIVAYLMFLAIITQRRFF